MQPNDGECHMEDNGYTHSTVQDYPSISQINLKVGINIFICLYATQMFVFDVDNSSRSRT